MTIILSSKSRKTITVNFLQNEHLSLTINTRKLTHWNSSLHLFKTQLQGKIMTYLQICQGSGFKPPDISPTCRGEASRLVKQCCRYLSTSPLSISLCLYPNFIEGGREKERDTAPEFLPKASFHKGQVTKMTMRTEETWEGKGRYWPFNVELPEGLWLFC